MNCVMAASIFVRLSAGIEWFCAGASAAAHKTKAAPIAASALLTGLIRRR